MDQLILSLFKRSAEDIGCAAPAITAVIGRAAIRRPDRVGLIENAVRQALAARAFEVIQPQIRSAELPVDDSCRIELSVGRNSPSGAQASLTELPQLHTLAIDPRNSRWTS